jgi:arylsulfatase A-like enzyme
MRATTGPASGNVPADALRASAAACACALLAVTLGASGCGHGRGPDAPKAPVVSYDADGRPNGPARAVPAKLPNLIVVVIDTLRRDAVSLRDGETGVMPHLAALARHGVACTQATSAAPWTVPSLVSLFTGLLPHEHGCTASTDVPHLPPSITTYPEILRNAYGYETAIFTGAPWFRQERDSILQGFARGDVGHGFGLQGTRPVLERWLKQRDPKRPYFLTLHTFEAHDPYGKRNHPYPDAGDGWNVSAMQAAIGAYSVDRVTEPWQMTQVYMTDRVGRGALRSAYGPEYMDIVIEYSFDGYARHPRPEMAAQVKHAYLDGLTWVDGLLEQTIHTLSSLGLLENTLLVVTGDHGEAFGEDGIMGHGRSLTEALVRVPLVLSGPGPFSHPKVVDTCTGLVDVFPTFLDWAGLPAPDGRAGHSILPALRGPVPNRPVISEEVLTPRNTRPGTHRLRAGVRDGRWKFLIEYDITAGRVKESVFDLHADPEARDDLRARWPDATFPWGDAFCEAVGQVRQRIWDEVESRHALAGTVYGGDAATVRQRRPEGCKPPR